MERDYVGVSLFCNNYFLGGHQRRDERILCLDLAAVSHLHDKEAIVGRSLGGALKVSVHSYFTRDIQDWNMKIHKFR